MYRVSSGFPGQSILRIGSIDDFGLMEGKLKPTVEQFVGSRVAWLRPVEGLRQCEGESQYGLSVREFVLKLTFLVIRTVVFYNEPFRLESAERRGPLVEYSRSCRTNPIQRLFYI